MEKEHTYLALNSAKTKDEELDHIVDRIVSGLFSVVVTMGTLSLECRKDTDKANHIKVLFPSFVVQKMQPLK